MTRILIAGDYVPCGRAAQLIASGRADLLFAPMHSLIEGADWSVVNLECAVTDALCRPIRKAGASLHCTVDDVNALRQAGFRMVTLANNHFADYGERGVALSLEAVRNAGLRYVGGGANLQEAAQTRYVTLQTVPLWRSSIAANTSSLSPPTHEPGAILSTPFDNSTKSPKPAERPTSSSSSYTVGTSISHCPPLACRRPIGFS